MPARVAIAVMGLVAALVVLVVGPDRLVVCGDGHLLDRAAQRVARGFGSGHVDGPEASFCSVPSGVSWAVAGVVLAGAASYAAARRLH